MIKLVEANGWHLDHIRGSHRQFRHPVKPGTTTIAGKPSATLPRGTERSILKQAGIDWRAMTGFAVIVERGEDGGFGAWCPDLPGCVAVGDTFDEYVGLMREAIPMHLDSLRRHGDPVPAPVTVGVLTIDAA